MNKTLHALMTKLQWQLTALEQQLQTLEKQLDAVELQCQENQQKITNACAIPAFILPEREIARLNFMICQSQHQDELTTKKTDLLSQKRTLTEKKIRLNTELKMLEKHQENKLKILLQQTALAEQKKADEWVLQQREPA
jgi:chromosome segregation ATPase